MILLYAACLLAVTPIETDVIQHRKSLTTGELVIVSESYKKDADGLRQTHAYKYHVWFKGEQLRVDCQSFLIEKKERKQMPFHSVARQNGIYYVYLFSPDIPDQTKQAKIMDQHDDPNLKWHKNQLFDPRLIGMGPKPFFMLNRDNWYSFVGFEKRAEEKQVSTLENGLAIEAVSFAPLETQRSTMRISKTQGPNLLQAEFNFGMGRYTMNSKLAEFPGAGGSTVWFPQQVEVLMYKRDDTIDRTTITTIQSATFNQPIKDDQFTLAKMDLLPGTPISDSRKKP